MPKSTEKALSAALLVLLRPLVKILLRNGIAYGAFAELAKKTYADVAYHDHVFPGKKQTFSRVSAITGLTRKEAKRLLELEETDDQGANKRYSRAIRVISGWLHDARYCDDKGEPLDLPVDKGEPSFASLVKKYSGDITTLAMYQTLSSAGNVATTDDGHIRLVSHAYIPSNDPVDKINILGMDAGELITTIDHNLTAPESQLRFQRKVSNKQICLDSIPEFKQLSAEESQALLEKLDHWLAQHECKGTPGQPKKKAAYVSLGIYFYEHNSDEHIS